MARAQVTRYVVDTEKAVTAVAKLSAEYNKNAQSLGGLVKEFSTATNAGKNILSSFTQINSSGQAVTTTISKTKKGIENYKVTVQEATQAQIRFVAEQKALNAALAQAQANFKPIVLDRQNKGELSQRFGTKGNALQAAIKKFNQEQLAIGKGTAAIGLLVNKSEDGFLFKGFDRANKAAQSLRETVKGLGSEFERIKNIGVATAVYRGISLIGQGLKESINQAAEFEKKIALVQTLSENSGESFDTWSVAIRNLADELGLPAVDVATAAYEGLSSQVINTTKDFEVLRAALKLGKLTESDSVTSLNVIAAAINGFKKSSSEASDIASKLFTTVDLGNVKVSELSSTLGRGSALAELTAGSFEELLAGVGLITQSGVDSAEAVTLLNNVFVQLTKPSEVLKEKLAQLGFQTGEQAVATLNLIGTLVELKKVSKDVPNGLAGLFPDIRGLRGAQSLLSNPEKFVDILGKIENSVGRVDRQYKELQKNNGDKFISELERIKTFFTTDIGQGFLDGALKATQQFGGLAESVKAATKSIIGATVAVVAFRSAFKLKSLITDLSTVTVQFLAMKKALGAEGALVALFGQSAKSVLALSKGLGLFGVVAGATYVAVDTLIKKNSILIDEKNSEAIQGAKRVAEAKIEAEAKAAAEVLKIFDKNLQDQQSKVGRFVSEQQRLMQKALRDTEKSGKAIASGLDNSFDIALTVLRKNVSETERLYEKANDAIEKIREVQAQEQVDRAEQFYERNAKLAELERDRFIAATGNKAAAYQSYIQKISALAEQRIAFNQKRQVEAVGKNDIQLAEQLNKEIRSILTNLQDETVDVNGITRPLFDQQKIQNRISAEADRFNKLLTDRIPLLQKEASEQGKLAFAEKVRAKEIEDLLNNTSKFKDKVVNKGAITEEFAGNPQEAITQLKALQKQAQEAISKVGGLKGQQTLENLGLTKDSLGKQFADQVNNLQQELNLARQGNALREVTEAQRKYGEIARSTLTDVNTKIAEQTALLEQNRLQVVKGFEAFKQGFKNQTSSLNSFDLLDRGKVNRFGVEVDKALQVGNTDEARAKLNELKGTLNQFRAGLQDFQTKDPLDLTKNVGAQQAIQSFEALLANIDNIKGQNLDQLKSVVQSLSTIDPTNIQNVEASLSRLYSESANFKGVGGIEKSRLELLRLIGLLETVKRLKDSIQLAPGAAPVGTGGKVEGKAFGGRAGTDGGFLGRFFDGAFKKGTDIIPTMLSRGEFVVREPMAEKYASLLTAIQYDRAPIYRAEGTPTGSTSVGDIYVTLPAGSTPTQVRAFASAVRRGVKQGTITLGNRN